MGVFLLRVRFLQDQTVKLLFTSLFFFFLIIKEKFLFYQKPQRKVLAELESINDSTKPAYVWCQQSQRKTH